MFSQVSFFPGEGVRYITSIIGWVGCPPLDIRPGQLPPSPTLGIRPGHLHPSSSGHQTWVPILLLHLPSTPAPPFPSIPLPHCHPPIPLPPVQLASGWYASYLNAVLSVTYIYRYRTQSATEIITVSKGRRVVALQSCNKCHRHNETQHIL